LTFLGIIAALVGAVTAMGGGADMARMQSALIGLLTITAAKFWTSMGGVLASIILRWVDRRWHSKVQRELERTAPPTRHIQDRGIGETTLTRSATVKHDSNTGDVLSG